MSKVIDLFGKDYDYTMLIEIVDEDTLELDYVGKQDITFNYSSEELKEDYEVFLEFVSRVFKRLERETGLKWENRCTIYELENLQVHTVFTDVKIDYSMDLKFTFIEK